MHPRARLLALLLLPLLLLLNACGDGASGAHARPSHDKNEAAEGWVSLTVGYYQVCGIRTDASGWCWQPNANGAGEPEGKVVAGTDPAPIMGNHAWASISTAYYHQCGIDTDGALWCWGGNTDGRLGLGNEDEGEHPFPKQLMPDHTWTTVDVGQESSCAVDDQHDLWCWGGNYSGTVGDGSNDPAFAPVEVGSDADWASVAVGEGQACGLDVQGGLWCWGGATADEAYVDGADARMPQRMGESSTAAGDKVCEVTDAAEWRCGLAGAASQPIDATHQWTAYATGDYHACALDSDQHMWCLGKNGSGQLGDGTVRDSETEPVEVSDGPGRWVAVEAAAELTCGIDTSGRAWCWGASSRSHEESDTLLDSTIPTPVPEPSQA